MAISVKLTLKSAALSLTEYIIVTILQIQNEITHSRALHTLHQKHDYNILHFLFSFITKFVPGTSQNNSQSFKTAEVQVTSLIKTYIEMQSTVVTYLVLDSHTDYVRPLKPDSNSNQ